MYVREKTDDMKGGGRSILKKEIKQCGRLCYRFSLCYMVDYHSRLSARLTLKYDHQLAGNHEL